MLRVWDFCESDMHRLLWHLTSLPELHQAAFGSAACAAGLGFLDSDFDRLFGGAAKPQAASMSKSAAASPMVASRAASNELEVNDHDFLGSFSSSR